MKKTLLLILISFQIINVFSQSNYASKIYHSTPQDLVQQKLLIPAFDKISSLDGLPRKSKKQALEINKEADEANEALTKILDRDYNLPYKMVSISQIEDMSASGHKYYLDMVLMPHQWKDPNPDALVPSFIRFKTANKMWILNNYQFDYYLYIRNLYTKEVYFTSKIRGNRDMYKAISVFLKQLKKDLENK